MFDHTWMDDLDGDGLADAVVEAHAGLLEHEARLLKLAVQWAMVHNGDALDTAGRVLPGMERAKRLGGPGTPRVQEFAAAELGALQGIGYIAASTLMADGLDLKFRHPRMWEAVLEGRARVWQARKVARAAREADLDLEQTKRVDAMTTPWVGSQPWSAFLDQVAAAIIKVDPQGAEERRTAAEMGRFVRTGRSSEYGLKTLIARARAGEVIFFTAMADRIAQILLAQGDTDPADVRRSKAIGILADPARALALLQAYAGEDFDGADPDGAVGAGEPDPDGAAGAGEPDPDGAAGAGEPDPDGAAGAGEPDPDGPADAGDVMEQDRNHDPSVRPPRDEPRPTPDAAPADLASHPPADPRPDRLEDLIGSRDVHPSQDDADDAREGPPKPCPACRGSGTLSRWSRHWVRPMKVDPAKLRPKATLYVHLKQDAFERASGTRSPDDVARLEGVGPITVTQAREFFGHCDVTVRPVLDLAGQAPVEAYEIPDEMREAVHLRNPREVFPFGSGSTRGAVPDEAAADLDHTIPHQGRPRPHDAVAGPVEQKTGMTHPDNLGPLSRYAHRVKTFGRWSVRQPYPGIWVWRSPHGYFYLVDHTGTQPLGRGRSISRLLPEDAYYCDITA